MLDKDGRRDLLNAGGLKAEALLMRMTDEHMTGGEIGLVLTIALSFLMKAGDLPFDEILGMSTSEAGVMFLRIHAEETEKMAAKGAVN